MLIRCEPSFAESLTLKFEQLAPGEVRRIDALDLKFNHRHLAELNESERGRVIVEVSSDGAVLAKADQAVEVLGTIGGAGTPALPELSAFVLIRCSAICWSYLLR